MRNTRTEFTKETKRQAYARATVNGVATCECHRIPHVFPVACGRRFSSIRKRMDGKVVDRATGELVRGRW